MKDTNQSESISDSFSLNYLIISYLVHTKLLIKLRVYYFNRYFDQELSTLTIEHVTKLLLGKHTATHTFLCSFSLK